MRDLGWFHPGETVYVPFDTFDGGTGASITMSGLAVTDIEIYKDGGTTQRASDNGYTLLDTDGIDFDGLTGIHGFSISLADNSTAGFWAAGSQYFVVVSSITVDAQTVSFVAATFRIGRPGAVLNTTIATLSSQTSFTLTNGPAEDDALNGMWCIIHDVASAVQQGWAEILDYTGSTKTVTLAAGTTFTAAASDNIMVMGLTPLRPGVIGRTVGVEANGKVTGVVLTDTVTTYTGNTPQTGDSFARIGANGAGLSAVPWNASWDAEVQSEVADALDAAVPGSPTANSINERIKTLDDADIPGRLPAALTGGGNIKADMLAVSGDTTAADRLEGLLDGIIVGQVNDAGASTTAFIADGFTEATNDHFNGRLITFVSGALSGQQTAITDYVGATQTFTVTALTEAPANDDFFVIH